MPSDASPTTLTDPFRLERFVRAQDDRGTYAAALAELRAGRKRSHWMWFVFPQVAGLGHSPTAREFAVSGLDEARAYLSHPVLGARLVECSRALVDLGRTDAVAILGGIDAVKLRSSMTLFRRAVPDGDPRAEVFEAVLAAFFDGVPDPGTLALI